MMGVVLVAVIGAGIIIGVLAGIMLVSWAICRVIAEHLW